MSFVGSLWESLTRGQRTSSSLVICGSGNAGHALAVVASRTFEGDVHWLVGSEEKAALLREQARGGGLRATGAIEGEARLGTITANAEEVVPDADVVVVAVPAFAHANVLSQIAPHLADEVLLGCAPARSGFEFDVARFVPGVGLGGRTIFGLQTLPWSTRIVERGSVVNFGAIKKTVLMATLPSAPAPAVAAELSRLFDIEIAPTPNFLNITLGNPGQHIHPGLMYGHFHGWSGAPYAEDDVPLFYAHATEDVAGWVEALSDETLAVAEALARAAAGTATPLDMSGVLTVHEWLRISYPALTGDLSSVSSGFRTGPLQARKAPTTSLEGLGLVPDFSYRYLSEDVPFGLVVTRAIAELAGVATPVIDQVVRWSQERLGVEYLVDGTVAGADASDLPTPQNHGIRTLDDLLGWYARERSGVELVDAGAR